MQFTNILAIAVLLAGSAVAAPGGGPPPKNPGKPPKPQPQPGSTTNQGNSCGNGAIPYCCDSDNGSYTKCKALGKKTLS